MTGGALASFTAGRLLPRAGYRRMLYFACLAGMGGSALAGLSAVRGGFAPFLIAFLFYGMAIGLVGMSRYAAAESSEPTARARAMGRVVVGATAGAVLGPLLVAPFGRLAESLGLPRLSGPWLASFLCYGAALINTWFWLRPEPKELARRLAAAGAAARDAAAAGGASAAGTAASAATSVRAGLASLLAQPRILLPMVSMVSAQAAMVLVMAITPLHMHHHHHPMGTISAVITAHFLGMYGLSVLSGWLADRLGRMRTVGLGGLVLAASCVLAPFSRTTPMLMVALFLLGLGWSFCFLGGSSALAEGLAEGERGRIQGFTEAMVSFSSGIASLSSGLLFAAFGFSNMTMVGLGVSALPLLCFLASPARARPLPAAGQA